VKVFWQDKGWFDREIAKNYEAIWERGPEFASIPKVLLVDNLDTHVETEFVSSMFSKHKVIVKSLPSNVTHFAQLP
jgi:hypothetical protein